MDKKGELVNALYLMCESLAEAYGGGKEHQDDGDGPLDQAGIERAVTEAEQIASAFIGNLLPILGVEQSEWTIDIKHVKDPMEFLKGKSRQVVHGIPDAVVAVYIESIRKLQENMELMAQVGAQQKLDYNCLEELVKTDKESEARLTEQLEQSESQNSVLQQQIVDLKAKLCLAQDQAKVSESRSGQKSRDINNLMESYERLSEKTGALVGAIRGVLDHVGGKKSPSKVRIREILDVDLNYPSGEE